MSEQQHRLVDVEAKQIEGEERERKVEIVEERKENDENKGNDEEDFEDPPEVRHVGTVLQSWSQGDPQCDPQSKRHLQQLSMRIWIPQLGFLGSKTATTIQGAYSYFKFW